MPFNSVAFVIFFLIFYCLYLATSRWHTLQNALLLAGCYLFYGMGDVRLVWLILLVSTVNFLTGLGLGTENSSLLAQPGLRRGVLAAGLIFNFGTLIFFKYVDFFNGGLERLAALLGADEAGLLVSMVIPIGISFYMLQVSSYLIDIYQRRLKPSRNPLDFFIFVAFFPQLLAGPIERAGRMLPQIQNPRSIHPDQVSAGLYLILSGFFKKLVVADNMGKIANPIFDNYLEAAGVNIWIGVLAFSVQLYADFSAISDIARGLAYLMGFRLMLNFRLPYFAQTPGEFWQRWHISLSEWLRDYIFYPARRWLLRFKTASARQAALYIPPLLTMLVSGLWHGTGWNFVVWGLYHGALLVAYQLLVKDNLPSASQPSAAGGFPKSVRAVLSYAASGGRMLVMFLLVCFGWWIFRAASLGQFFYMLSHASLAPSETSLTLLGNLLSFSLPLLAVQVLQQWRGEMLLLAKLPAPLRLLVYGACLAMLVAFGAREASEFIYAQF